MLHKSFDAEVKSADAETGTFQALVAVFGNVDSVGDRIIKGAFSKTLEKWRATGDPIPVILSHKHDDPMAHIGYAHPDNVIETDRGLQVSGTLDVNDNETAKQVHRLMKRRSLKEFSFGYRIPKGGEKAAKDGANELLQIDLIEVGPCLKGANPSTELHAVKSALEKAEWSAAYVNALPDSAFLYVEKGDLDDEGKTTPRTLRHFPVKNVGGSLDMQHVRVAAARIPDSDFSDEVKETLAKRVEEVLVAEKADPPSGKELRRTSDANRLDDLMEGAPDPEVLAAESVEQLNGRVKTLIDEIDGMRAQVERPPASADALRRESQEQRLKDADVPEGEPEPESDPDVVDARMKAMQDELAAIRKALEEKEPEPTPPSTDQLRRSTQQQRLKDAEVPEGDAPDPAKELADQVREVQGELVSLKAQLAEATAKPTEEPSAAELRRVNQEQRLREAAVPEGEAPDPVKELADEVKQVHAELSSVKTTLEQKAEPEPPSDDELRRTAQRERLKKAAVPEGEPEPKPDRIGQLSAEVKSELAKLKEALEREPEPTPPTADELRRQTQRDRLKDAEVPEGEAEPLPNPIEELRTELAEKLTEIKEAVEREPEAEPKSEEELRRNGWKDHLKDLGVEDAPVVDPIKEQLQAQTDELAAIRSELAEVKSEPPRPPEPPSEEKLRREAVRGELRGLGVGDVPVADPVKELTDQLKAQGEELAALKAELAEAKKPPEPEPQSAEELRRTTQEDRLKKANVADAEPPDRFKELADLIESQTAALRAELAVFKAEQEKPAPPSAEELRRADARERLKNAAVVDAAVAEKEDAVKQLAAQVADQTEAVRTEIERLKEAVERRPEATDAELRRRSQAERLNDAGLAKIAPPKADDEVAKQLRTLTEMLGGLEQRLERIKDPAPEEPHGAKGAGHDPLRKRSDAAVLEIASQGQSRRKPPKREQPKPQAPEGESEKALRRRSRDVTMSILMGSEEAGQ